MELTYASILCLLLQTVVAVPNPFPLPTPAPAADLVARQGGAYAAIFPTFFSQPASASQTGTLTGAFTGLDGGVYEVTAVSGYVEVAGHTLSAGGGDAMVGEEIVSVATGGVLANGATVEFGSVMSTSSTMSTSSASSSSSPASSGSTGSAAAGSSAAASSTKSKAGAVATSVPMAGAVLGGIMGLIFL